MTDLKSSFLMIFLSFFGLSLYAQGVTDEGDFFTEAEEKKIIERAQKSRDLSSVQTLVYTVNELGGRTVAEVALALANQYAPGIKGMNNGILILISKKERRSRLAVGLGLEWTISDEESQRVIDKMITYFKKGEFSAGVINAIGVMESKVGSLDWKVYPLEGKPKKKDNGKIFKIPGPIGFVKEGYQVPDRAGNQFSEDYQLPIVVNKKAYNLHYSKYMNDLVLDLQKADLKMIYVCLVGFKEKKLQLLGVE
ncbi:MAG: TPM domain-containing protein [Bacteroidota bacterium]